MSKEPTNIAAEYGIPDTLEVKSLTKLDYHLGAVTGTIYAQEWITRCSAPGPNNLVRGSKEHAQWTKQQLQKVGLGILQALPDELPIDRKCLSDLVEAKIRPPRNFQDLTPALGCVALAGVTGYLLDMSSANPSSLSNRIVQHPINMGTISTKVLLLRSLESLAARTAHKYMLTEPQIMAAGRELLGPTTFELSCARDQDRPANEP
jgi:hypothetical protein